MTQGNATRQELFHLSSTSRLRVHVQVPQAYAALIRPGIMASLTTAAMPGKPHPAKVVATAQSIDSSTRTLLTQLEADNSDGGLR